MSEHEAHRNGSDGNQERANEIVVELTRDLDAQSMDARLRQADRRTEIGHRELAFYLAEMQDRRLHQMLGYASAVEYACRRLEMSKRHAQELIATGRALEELPRIDEAFCAGRLRWSRVRLLVRIAVRETEAAWLERALALPWTELDREIATSERGRPPRRDRRGLPRVRIVVKGRLERVAYETWETAKKKLEAERGEPMSDADCMEYAGAMILGTRRGAPAEVRERVDDSIYRVVIQKCPDCDRPSMHTPEGLEEIDAVTADCIACDAATVNPEHPDHEDKTPKALRDRILLRDGFACRACRGRQQLMVHHVVWLSRGGPTKAANLVTLCFRCHGLVHDDLLIVRGRAPNGLAFTDRHGIPLDATVPLGGAAIARIRMDAPAPGRMSLRPSDGEIAPSESGETVTLAHVAAEVSQAWWLRHQHLFTWSESTGELKFHAGEAAPPPADAGPADAARNPAAARSRPARLADVIGQAAAVRTLEAAAKAAARDGTAADHVLLLGAAGVGKTTLAGAIAAEIGTRLRGTNGAAIRDPGVLIRLLTNVADRDVVFIDEVHALPRRVMESLYEAMEDRGISLTVTDGHASKTVRIALPAFTLVAATTEIARLPEPFVSRFPIRQHLMPYGDAEIEAIVSRAAARGSVEIDAEAAGTIAALARGGARQALAFLRRVRNEVVAAGGDRRIDRAWVSRALEAAGIGPDGLSVLERQALDVLAAHGGPVGVGRWAAAAGLAPAVIRQSCEPELVRRGLVVVTPRGRMARQAPCAQLRAVARDVKYGRIPEVEGAAGALSRDRARSAG
jgi:Holliday junction DNA helicase RuvB